MKRISGLYMHECWPVEPSPEAQDPYTGSALWDLSDDIVTEFASTATATGLEDVTSVDSN